MKKYKRAYIISAVAVVVLAAAFMNRSALAMLGFDWFVQGAVADRIKDTYKPVDRQPKPVPVSEEKNEEEPFSVLLLGVDQRGKEIGRADTMIYTVVRPSDGNMLLVSIPRDTYVEIVGKDYSDKINHSYAFGGAGMTMDTVEKLFDAPVDHYASINFQGFRDAIDAMGGISLPIEEDMINDDYGHEKFIIKGGQDLYNGKDALNYVRYREDAGGDMSRTERHQEFLSAMIEKATEMKQWSKIPELMDIMGENFSTDIPPNELIDLAQGLLQADNRTMYNHTLLGHGGRLVEGGTYLYFVDEADLASVQTMIKNWLNADTNAASLVLPSKYGEQPEKEVESLSGSSSANETE
ncbi:LytR family transcriptional regulator [Paenibacillus nanensis]|uniref:LytR family transcriptional regulator n=1 Tax=Paenibacillus nanensis TaxID=393251 RepID=A0A3A1UK71_9BACL|nr:LCP family protein [Paenibacillus nanensis]RIX47088.1 LytR family transcriptional regulator [Paenibacillus nanensis]